MTDSTRLATYRGEIGQQFVEGGEDKPNATTSDDGIEPHIAERMIDKMLDYDLLADPEDEPRNMVIACDLIRLARGSNDA